ncbi:MAG: hypothetical protein MJ131_01380 [Lachnospiraceae bacterium]|nr:hypothetical protein [Lachnospiraceae bacterium]
MASNTFSFSALPANVGELQALAEAEMKTPFQTAALAVAVFCRYENSVDDCIAMLDYLKGPEPTNNFDKQFIRDRLVGKTYVPRSYFAGTSPSNNYQATAPYTVTVSDNPYSYTNENYATLWISSSGADNPRQITLRLKPSTGVWYVNDYKGLLPDIRKPVAEDPWA